MPRFEAQLDTDFSQCKKGIAHTANEMHNARSYPTRGQERPVPVRSAPDRDRDAAPEYQQRIAHSFSICPRPRLPNHIPSRPPETICSTSINT